MAASSSRPLEQPSRSHRIVGGVVEELVRGGRYPNKRLRGHYQPQIFLIQFIDGRSHQRCSVKKGVLRNFAKFNGKHLCQCLYFNNVAGLNFIKKEALAQVFSCEFCEIFKNTFFTEHFWATVSVSIQDSDYSNVFLIYGKLVT